MAYARFSDSGVYVFASMDPVRLNCSGCYLGGWRSFDSTQAMVDHLAEHRAAGHDVPYDTEAELWADDRENFGGTTDMECQRLYPEVGLEHEGFSCLIHNGPWGECPQPTEVEQ